MKFAVTLKARISPSETSSSILVEARSTNRAMEALVRSKVGDRVKRSGKEVNTLGEEDRID